MPRILPSIKIREDFVKISEEGNSSTQDGFILQSLSYLDKKTNKRLGITVTKKIGSAVVRNRCKRRLKAIANEIILYYGKERTDYVLIARKKTLNRNTELLKKDLMRALSELKLSEKNN